MNTTNKQQQQQQQQHNNNDNHDNDNREFVELRTLLRNRNFSDSIY